MPLRKILYGQPGGGVQLTELPQLQFRVVGRVKFLPGQLRRHLEAGGKEPTPLQDFALMARVLHFTGREVCEIVGVPYKEVTTE